MLALGGGGLYCDEPFSKPAFRRGAIEVAEEEEELEER